ncbi:YckD family protein [Rossellomorea aquimaris]|uniref:YckD family protein n=1 Tax=Rossellomorea aquimaris TaxID=189382 RepID=UPI000AAF46DD|nr:YckD family protein [Rossellomorea aquimaris]
MRKVFLSILVVFIMSLGIGSFATAEGEQQNPQVKLTEEQKSELSKLHDEMLATKKELINKYVEYGVFTKEQGDTMLKMLEKKHEKLKENDFMMRWHPHHGKLKQDSNQ